MFCVKCGNKLSETARFCKKCGNPTRNRVAPSSLGGANPPPPSRQKLPSPIMMLGVVAIVAVIITAFGVVFWLDTSDEVVAEIPGAKCSMQSTATMLPW